MLLMFCGIRSLSAAVSGIGSYYLFVVRRVFMVAIQISLDGLAIKDDFVTEDN